MAGRWRWVFIFLIPPVVLGVLSALSWIVLAGGEVREPRRIEIVIPAGAAQRIAEGVALPSIPDKAVYVVGDRLVFRNEDQVDHHIGQFWIPAGTTLIMPLERATTISYLCSVHPSGTLELDVRPSNSPWLMAIPTFGLGIPLGLILVAIVRVVSRL